MIEPHADRPQAITLGADKAYDAEDFVNELRSMKVTPHVAQNTSGRSSAIDGRTTRHAGYAVSQRIRKRIEEAFGWSRLSEGVARIRQAGSQDGRRTRADQVSRMRSRRMGLQLRCHRLQSEPAAEAVGGVGMSTPPNCQLNRRRRIVKSDICDRHHLPTCASWR